MSSLTLEQPLEHEIYPDVQEQLLEYPGKWAAITRSQIIAIGDSPEEVLKKAREAGVEPPILYKVPEDRNVVFF